MRERVYSIGLFFTPLLVLALPAVMAYFSVRLYREQRAMSEGFKHKRINADAIQAIAGHA